MPATNRQRSSIWGIVGACALLLGAALGARLWLNGMSAREAAIPPSLPMAEVPQTGPASSVAIVWSSHQELDLSALDATLPDGVGVASGALRWTGCGQRADVYTLLSGGSRGHTLSCRLYDSAMPWPDESRLLTDLWPSRAVADAMADEPGWGDLAALADSDPVRLSIIEDAAQLSEPVALLVGPQDSSNVSETLSLASSLVAEGWHVALVTPAVNAAPLMDAPSVGSVAILGPTVRDSRGIDIPAEDVAPTLAAMAGAAFVPANGLPHLELIRVSDELAAQQHITLAARAAAFPRDAKAAESDAGTVQARRDIDLAQASLDAGNWRAGEQLARLAIGARIRAAVAATDGMQHLQRMYRWPLVALLLIPFIAFIVLGSGRGWFGLLAATLALAAIAYLVGHQGITPNNGSLPAAYLIVLGACLVLTLLAALVDADLAPAAVWNRQLSMGVWLLLLLLIPIGAAFALDGPWPTSPPALPQRTYLLRLLLQAVQWLGLTIVAASACVTLVWAAVYETVHSR